MYKLLKIIVVIAAIAGGVLTGGCNSREGQSEVYRDSLSGEIPEDSIVAALQAVVDSVIPEAEPEVIIDTIGDGKWQIDYIVIDKGEMNLKVFDKEGKVRMKFPVGVAINYGNKRRKGDHKTPEGEFPVSMVQKSSNWTHDFHDGKGVIKGCYGPYFIRLKTPITTMIGIHGTHLPSSIGTRCTEGCVRLNNEHVALLAERVKPGIIVKILPGPEDEKANLQGK